MKKLGEAKQGIMTMLAITGVNIINYGLNLVLGRWLGPEGFAEANLIATLILIISFLGVAVQLTVASEVARSSETEQAGVLRWIEKRAIILGIIIGLIGFTTASYLSSFLQLESSLPIILVSIGIPFYFTLSARRGLFQGKQNFQLFAKSFIVETLVRLAATLGLLYFTVNYDPSMNTIVIAVGFLLSFVFGSIYSLMASKIGRIRERRTFEMKTIVMFVGVITMYELSQILINNFDVILTKHFFDDYTAGIYSSIALVGRIVYFGTWTIVTLLFPKVIEKEVKGESHTHLFYGALSIVLLAGVGVSAFCFVFDKLIVGILFGVEFISASELLWQYAFATTLFASANVFAYYYMSLKNYLPVIISLLAGIGQIILIYHFHSNLQEVIYMQIITMTVLLLVMISFHVINSYLKMRIEMAGLQENVKIDGVLQVENV
jgi:O-antigen/teichoic acid export membrane protein